MKPLYKTVIVIWTEFDPRGWEIDSLARESVDGEAYCSQQLIENIENPEKDPDWDGTEFFGEDDEDEEE